MARKLRMVIIVFGPPGYVATSIPISFKLWTCARKQAMPQHVYDWYGKRMRHAEWRAQTRIALIRHLNGRILGTGNTMHGNVPVYLNTYTRTDHNIHHYVMTNKWGPTWSDVIRRVTINLDANTVIQDVAIADQPTGYDWHAPLPEGVANISTRMYWQPEEPVMLGNEPAESPQKPRRVLIDDCPSLLPTLAI
eukprot:8598170-Pyramimonas_sp.AAC.1